MEVDARSSGASWRWSLLFSVVFLNICLPSLVLAYGVLWLHLTSLDVPVWLGLSTPTIYLLTFGLTQCWFREAADSWGGSTGYRAMAAVGIVVTVASLLTCAFVPLYLQPFIYGVFGGLGSSLISAQVDAVIFETYDSRLAIIRGICSTGQAVGQSLFPHIISVLINYYGYSFSFIVLGGIILQALPAVLFLKIDESVRRSGVSSKYSDFYKNYKGFQNDGADNYYTAELQLIDLSKKCWKSPSDDNLHREDEAVADDEVVGTITPPPSPEEKRRNIFGVDILPDIPEESEESEDDIEQATNVKESSNNQRRFSLAIKRLSTLGDNLDEYITKQIRKDSKEDCSNFNNREHSEIEVTYDNISPMTEIHREKVLNSFSFRYQSTVTNIKRRFWIPSYRMYRVKRRLLYFMYNINDTFIKPLTRSLSCWRFYPALLLSFAKLCLTAVFLNLIPMIAQQVRPKISMFETNFLLSLHGFTWICFLLSTPWLAQTPKRNFKYVAVFGLITSTIACFVFAQTNNHDSFAIGCVISGLGYGAVTSCCETAVQDFVGARKWPKFHSTLETFSATLLTIFVVCLSFIVGQEHGYQNSMFIIGIVLSAVTFLWLVLAIIALYDTKLKYLRPNWRCLF
ncbi:Monocarboxylate transporter 9 [Papilio xuthus]|uniref:Monocarboxylate transporter 9 n=1 Tax=Papilio xuthus TaxID=66420 RepID=A0A194Q8X0_PAPXU|nr:Monocarboxylate transporter 9 [Papilio xuthus]